ncbi:MAG: DUF2139 domain-containing protein [Acidilobaceae archaeon]|nr:DUF2139 domain-containing protein [Acidilobaceae archaeon]MCX8165747.1 DUF2139 domain-containing protein [Acidilobaceae archaeon]MDW7974172.1 DUF2139 domain-containing protein [Sulfolobales archaeon]
MSYEGHLQIWGPSPGPEWGSGGIFGLSYCNRILYFTLAFEAKAFFLGREARVYDFHLVGPGPASGGDTYNAVYCGGEELFFGGWVHAPVVFKGKTGTSGEIDFRNKHSHVHVYDTERDEVRLLWKESAHHESRWVGEISEIVFSSLRDSLFLARGDGHENLGIFELERGGKMHRLSDLPGLKGAHFLDYACFDIQGDWAGGIDGIQCFDLQSAKSYRYFVQDWTKVSVDGGGVLWRGSGYAISAFARYYHFFRGGVLVGNPVEPELERPTFLRLMDFGVRGAPQPSPQRSNALPIGGGILAPFSSMPHGGLHIPDVSVVRDINEVRAPSVLIYISPPQARIVGVYGARITSMTKAGSKVLIGYNTAPNLGGKDSSPLDIGFRGITSVDEEQLINRQSPPVLLKFRGNNVLNEHFGGIPLLGYRERKLVLLSSRDNVLEVFESDAGTPPELLSSESYSIKTGKNEIDLGGFVGIVSFRVRERDSSLRLYVSLQ